MPAIEVVDLHKYYGTTHAVAGISFVTPYAYLLIAGHQSLPVYVKAGVVAVVALIATASVLRVRQACLADEAALVLEPTALEL